MLEVDEQELLAELENQKSDIKRLQSRLQEDVKIARGDVANTRNEIEAAQNNTKALAKISLEHIKLTTDQQYKKLLLSIQNVKNDLARDKLKQDLKIAQEKAIEVEAKNMFDRKIRQKTLDNKLKATDIQEKSLFVRLTNSVYFLDSLLLKKWSYAAEQMKQIGMPEEDINRVINSAKDEISTNKGIGNIDKPKVGKVEKYFGK